MPTAIRRPHTAGKSTATVWLLGVAETMFWAASFYVFHALLPRWEAHFGWNRAEVSTGLTLSLLCSALFAPLIGMFIDRGHARLMFVVGGLLASMLLVSLSMVTTLTQFYVVWIVIGLCHAAILYEPCFAILTRIYETDAKKAITRVTLMAGFAGTIAFPLAHALSETIGWQRALWVFAGICVVATGLAARALAGTETAIRQVVRVGVTPKNPLRAALRSPVFWLIAASFSMMSLNHGALLPHLLPLLQEREFSSGTAVLAAALIGPMQVIGRICMVAMENRLAVTMITVVSFSAVTLASVALLLSAWSPAFVFLFVVLQGAGYGVTSITRPAVTAEYLGREGFGAISGSVAIPYIAAFALGPIAAALIWFVGGYSAVLVATASVALIGTLAFLVAHRLVRRDDPANAPH